MAEFRVCQRAAFCCHSVQREGDGEGFHGSHRDDPAYVTRSVQVEAGNAMGSGVQGSQRLPVWWFWSSSGQLEARWPGTGDNAPRRPFGSSSMFRLQRTCNPARLCTVSGLGCPTFAANHDGRRKPTGSLTRKTVGRSSVHCPGHPRLQVGTSRFLCSAPRCPPVSAAVTACRPSAMR